MIPFHFESVLKRHVLERKMELSFSHKASEINCFPVIYQSFLTPFCLVVATKGINTSLQNATVVFVLFIYFSF